MKLILLFIYLSSLFIISCNPGNDKKNEDLSSDLINNPISAEDSNITTEGLPVFSVAESIHDFGVIIQGEKVSHVYKFKNVGKSDLIISNVKASCGCTVPKYDKEPVKPSGEGEIEIVFDSSGRTGRQHKTITVITNSQPNTVELSFTAEILVPEE
ncbi:MAG: DUF1573 domain-containing protein [Bacteroidota bacterium]